MPRDYQIFASNHNDKMYAFHTDSIIIALRMLREVFGETAHKNFHRVTDATLETVNNNKIRIISLY